MSKKGEKVTAKVSLNFKPGLTLGEFSEIMAKNETDNPLKCKEIQDKLARIEIKDIKDNEDVK